MDNAIAVLVVDDDADIRSIVEETLIEGGFAPKIASTGEEAIALLSATKYGAVVIDISFGRDRVRGWSVARRARAFNPSLSVIYITGGHADDWAIEGVPGSVLLTKPFTPPQLVAAISQLLVSSSSER